MPGTVEWSRKTPENEESRKKRGGDHPKKQKGEKNMEGPDSEGKKTRSRGIHSFQAHVCERKGARKKFEKSLKLRKKDRSEEENQKIQSSGGLRNPFQPIWEGRKQKLGSTAGITFP